VIKDRLRWAGEIADERVPGNRLLGNRWVGRVSLGEERVSARSGWVAENVYACDLSFSAALPSTVLSIL
jgi:hypothetical protein